MKLGAYFNAAYQIETGRDGKMLDLVEACQGVVIGNCKRLKTDRDGQTYQIGRR